MKKSSPRRLWLRLMRICKRILMLSIWG
jgi:hypothetical protein